MVEKKETESSTPRKTRAPSKARTKRAKDGSLRGSATKYSPEMCGKAREHFKEGYGMPTLGAALGVGHTSVYNWRKVHPEFDKACSEGEETALLWWENKGREGMTGKISGFNAAVWIFNMKNKFGWRDKQEISGDAEAPLTIEIVKLGEGK